MKEIILTQGKVALVDDADYEWLNRRKWYAQKKIDGKFYAMRESISKRPNRKKVAMHRLITNAPVGVEVDHRDGNSLNNTRGNLRFSTRGQNSQNRDKMPSNTSGYKGVHWERSRQKWIAAIGSNGKTIKLGRFQTAEEAAKAYDEAARRLHGEFARTNF